MNLSMITNGGVQYISPVAAVPQIIYLDTDGEKTAYNGKILSIDNVTVRDSQISSERMAEIVDELNLKYASENVLFVTERPSGTAYSTIFIGKTGAFDQYGNFDGIAETVDKNNARKSDNAFVMLDAGAANSEIIAVICHETDHLLGILAHDGEGLNAYAANIDIYAGTTSSGLKIKSGNSVYASAGGSVVDSIVSSGGGLYICHGGFADNVQVKSKGCMHIAGGTANNTVVASSGTLIVSAGGTANNTVVSRYGCLHLSRGGMVNGVTIKSSGCMYISAGGSFSDITLENYGSLHIGNDIEVDNLSINGRMYISSGGTATGTTINSKGDIYVYNGGIAEKTVVNSQGNLRVSSGGTAYEVAVNEQGDIYIMPGGTAYDITCFSGASLSISGLADTVVINEYGWGNIDSGGTAINATVNSSGGLYVSSGGTALNTSVTAYGELKVYSGGRAENTVIGLLGSMCVSSGGTAVSTTIKPGGELYVSSGGTAVDIIWTPCVGSVYAEYGAHVTYAGKYSGVYLGSDNQLISTGTVMSDIELSGKDFAVGNMYVMSGGTANHIAVNENGELYIMDGGIADNTELQSGDGEVYVMSGGTANNTKVKGGNLSVEGGVINNTSIGYYEADVLSGGIANDTVIGYYGILFVSSGGIANRTTVNRYGGLKIKEGGVADSITLNDFGGLGVSSGGMANSVIVNNSAVVDVSGGSAVDVTILSGGSVFVSSGGAVCNTFIDADGYIEVRSDSIISNTSVCSGGSLSIAPQGLHRGFLQIDQGGVVSAYTGAKIDFTVAERTSADGFLINDFSLITGHPYFSITVAADQKTGIYKLAGNASSFAGSITVGDGSVSYGILTVNAGELSYGDSNYKLILESGNLLLNVVTIDRTPPAAPGASADIVVLTNKFVTVTATFSTDSVIREYSFNGQDWLEYTKSIVVKENTNVYFRAKDEAGNVSEVTTCIVNNIDNTPPETPEVMADITTATNKVVTVSAIFSEDSVIGEFSLNGKNWQAYFSEVKLEENGTVYFRSADQAGNYSQVAVYNVDYIDKTAPEKPIAIADITGVTNTVVTVTAQFSSDSVWCEFSRDKLNWEEYIGGIEFSENGIVYFRSADAAGNYSEITGYSVQNIDKIPPEKPKVMADVTDITNQNVTVTAEFGDEAVVKEFSYDQESWQIYTNGVEVSENRIVYFRSQDAIGNCSETVAYKVNNIDKSAPGVPENINVAVKDKKTELTWNSVADSGVAGVKGYYVRYGSEQILTGDGIFTDGNKLLLSELAGGTYYCQIRTLDNAGNLSDWSACLDFYITWIEDLQGTVEHLSWKALDGSSDHIVAISSDDFAHILEFAVAGNQVDLYALPQGSYQWQVKTGQSDQWVSGNDLTASAVPDRPQKINSDNDGNIDIFFARVAGQWSSEYFAQHLGCNRVWEGTQEKVVLTGKNRIDDIFIGSNDENILILTDDANGDSLFVENIYSSYGDRARLSSICEIRAGAGDDVVDMTSSRFVYKGSGVTVYGGDGNDVIWANCGKNILSGDEGNDRIVGGTGDDVIIGGSGDDLLHGGGGNDIFCFGGDWGSDSVEQLAAGSITLWFEDGSEDNWDAVSLTYTDGKNSVTVSGTDNITLNFGGGTEELPQGAFAEAVSSKIYEEKDNAMLA